MSVIALTHRAATAMEGAHPHVPPGTVPLDSGLASPGLLPDMTAAAQLALTTHRNETMQYSARAGLAEMRAWIADHVNADDIRVPVQPSEVLVVNGAKQGIELACQLLVEAGDPVVVTGPTYYNCLPLFRAWGAQVIEVPQDDEGMDTAVLAQVLDTITADRGKLPKMIYDVPDFHNPSGITMSRRRRESLLALAARHSIPVLEDSPYRPIRFEGPEIPSLRALDTASLVISVGTFSKLITPGLRLGWMVGRPDWIARMAQMKSDGGSPALTQRMILEFSRSGQLARHRDRACATYRQHRDRMVAALRQHMPSAGFTVPEGGYYLWVNLPDPVDGYELAKLAAEKGVAVLAGRKCYEATASRHPRNTGVPNNQLRLAYSTASPDEIEHGIRRLAEALDELSAKGPGTAS